MSGKRNWGDNMTNRMDGKEPPPVFDAVPKVPSRAWKKKYKCKKNKGEHTLEIKKIRIHWFDRLDDGSWVKNHWQSYYVTWECTGCKKLVLEWTVPDKRFDKYRHTIWT